MAIGSGRWGGLRQEPYNPNPKDADNDGIVQEGTPFERPIGTRYVTAAGEEISSAFDGSNISQLNGLRLVDENGNTVSYRQSWREEALSLSEQQDTIGSSMGTVGQTLGTIDKVPATGDYRGAHSAPGRDGGAPLHALTELYPEDVYSPDGMRLYGSGLREDAAKDREMFAIIERVRGNPDAELIMYRAVPEGVDTINPGDWVTPSREYAIEHGEGPMRGQYRIIEQRVRAGDLFTDGNYIYEFGYDPMPVAKPVDNRDLSPAARELQDEIIPSWGSGFESADLDALESVIDRYDAGEIDDSQLQDLTFELAQQGIEERLDMIASVYGSEAADDLRAWIAGRDLESIRDRAAEGELAGVRELIADSPPKDTLWRGMTLDAETQRRLEEQGFVSMPIGATSDSERAANEYSGYAYGHSDNMVMLRVEGANAFPAMTISPVDSDSEWLVSGDFEIVEVGEYLKPRAMADTKPIKMWTVRPRQRKEEGSMRGSTGVPSGKDLSTEDKGIMFSSVDEEGTVIQGNKKVNPDGTLSIEGMNADGSFIEFSPETEAALDARYEELGVTREELTLNLAHSAMLAMGYDPTTGEFDADAAERGRRMSLWYSEQGEALRLMSEKYGVTHENIVAAATVMSAGRLWSGPKNGNIETAERLITILKEDKPIEVSEDILAFIEWRRNKASKKPSRLGLSPNLKAGEAVRPSDLDSAELVELLYAINTLRGYTSFSEWQRDSNNGKKSPRMHRTTEPIYPLFTSKGTLQVKQAVSVLRGDVSVREAISGPKYSSFFSNLFRPDLDYSSTNDTWHYRVMAGNLVLNPLTKKDKVNPGTMRELTLKDFSPTGTVVSAQDLFQSGLSRVDEGLANGDLMFRDSTKMTRGALAALRLSHPEIFGEMKIHELQALVWVYYGGGTMGAAEGIDIWGDALAKLPVDGSWVNLV
jgi:hypothetical protein